MKNRLAKRLGAAPVSEIGLGCWQMGNAGWGDVSDAGGAGNSCGSRSSRGVTFLDTADVYGAGKSESRVGKFLEIASPADGGKSLFVASKLGRLKRFSGWLHAGAAARSARSGLGGARGSG